MLLPELDQHDPGRLNEEGLQIAIAVLWGCAFSRRDLFRDQPRIQVEVLGAERRRRWSYDDKVRLVEETLQAGEAVCSAARRHGLAQSLLFNWRRQARQDLLGGETVPTFVPVEITSTPVSLRHRRAHRSRRLRLLRGAPPASVATEKSTSRTASLTPQTVDSRCWLVMVRGAHWSNLAIGTLLNSIVLKPPYDKRSKTCRSYSIIWQRCPLDGATFGNKSPPMAADPLSCLIVMPDRLRSFSVPSRYSTNHVPIVIVPLAPQAEQVICLPTTSLLSSMS